MKEAEHPRPQTVKDLLALSEGPIKYEKYAVTEEDRRNGYAIVCGNRIEIAQDVKTVQVPILPAVSIFHSKDHEILAGFDPDGVMWKLCRYSDGRWFRQRVN